MRMAAALLALVVLFSPLQAQGGTSRTEIALAKSVGASTMTAALVAMQQIGSLADETVTGHRTTKDVIHRANALRNLLLYVVKSLHEVKAVVPAADKAAFQTYALLLTDIGEVGAALVDFAGGKAEAAATFRQRRSAAWRKIVKMGGFNADAARNLAPGGADLRVPGR